MNRLRWIQNGNRCLRLLSFLSFLIVSILFFTSCTSKPGHYSILEFKGEDAVINYSKSMLYFSYESDSVNKKLLLANNDDIILYGNNKFFYYREPSQNKFLIETLNEADYINGKINSINIPGNDDLIPWLKQVKTMDLSKLEFLNFTSTIQEGYVTYLIDLAKLKPDIGLVYEGELKDLASLFKIFNPRFIIGVNLSRKDFDLLPGLTNLESLLVSLNDSLNTISLPAMPQLKQLLLVMDKDIKLSDDFLINNKQVERLTLKYEKSGRFNFSLIEPLTNLKELKIFGLDTIENFDLIKNHHHLELLSITDAEFKNYPTLNELSNIRWMSFSPNATQNEFNSFVIYHPDLEVIEIFNNNRINSLQPLLKLRKFYGLIITDTLTDIATIKSLRNLKYLSLPKVVLNDSIRKNELQKSLPDCRIVANEGFCLGSGWLILIIPLILLFRFFNPQKYFKFMDGI